MKLKTKVAICAWTFNLAVVIAGYNVLIKPEAKGYTEAESASLYQLYAKVDQSTDGMLKHISVADIGLDAEQFMDGVQ